jgi:methionyl-tRNA formyltransferase
MLTAPDNPRMKVVFAGTPEFAAAALKALIAAKFDIALVLTQPDRPAGRGMQLPARAVKQLAQVHGIAVAQPRSLRLDGKYPDDAHAAKAQLEAIKPDVMVVAAYGLILPQWVLDVPAHGCLNIHGSMLPRWRGAAPIHRAIEAGDSETGITIMQMDAGLDTGDMLLLEKLPIASTDTTATLHDKLAALGARLIVEALEMLACGGLPRTPQPSEGVTYAHKIDKAEAALDVSLDAATLARKVRALNPAPGATLMLNGETVKCWLAEAMPDSSIRGSSAPGQLLRADAQGVCVACGSGALNITELQRPGGKRISAAQFAAGMQAR